MPFSMHAELSVSIDTEHGPVGLVDINRCFRCRDAFGQVIAQELDKQAVDLFHWEPTIDLYWLGTRMERYNYMARRPVHRWLYENRDRIRFTARATHLSTAAMGKLYNNSSFSNRIANRSGLQRHEQVRGYVGDAINVPEPMLRMMRDTFPGVTTELEDLGDGTYRYVISGTFVENDASMYAFYWLLALHRCALFTREWGDVLQLLESSPDEYQLAWYMGSSDKQLHLREMRSWLRDSAPAPMINLLFTGSGPITSREEWPKTLEKLYQDTIRVTNGRGYTDIPQSEIRPKLYWQILLPDKGEK